MSTNAIPDHDTFGPMCLTLDMRRDADARFLVITGLAWLGGPKTQRHLADWLVDHVEVLLPECWRLPDGVRAYVEARR